MYDTIIIGAGTAGCVLAGRLSEDASHKVLLLEAGGDAPINSRVPSDWPSLFHTENDWEYHTVAQAECFGRRIFWPRGKMVGGSGAMNAMIYIRGLPSDFDTWEELGCPGWGWKDVLPDFIASETNANLSDPASHGTSGPLHVELSSYVHPYERAWVDAAVSLGYPRNSDFNDGLQEGFGALQYTIKAGERAGTGRMYLAPALDRPNLTLRKHVMVTRILSEDGKATGVQILVNGVPEVIHARRVVMAAGAIGTPHLLLLSGFGPAAELKAAGVTPVADIAAVGKNLQDHAVIQYGMFLRHAEGVGTWDAEFLAASFREWEEHRTGPRSSPWANAVGHVASRPGIDPDLQIYGVISPHQDYSRWMAMKPGMTVHTVLQRPLSRGELTLRSADPLEYPAIDPRYYSDPDGVDLQTLVEGLRIQRRIAAAAPMAELITGEMEPIAGLETDQELGDFVRAHTTTIYHPCGTCRMGEDDGAVVDPTSFAVKGVEGLYVADASVFPTVPSGNINATVILVAERAARALAL